MPETSPTAQPTPTAEDEPTAAELLEQFDRAIAEEEFDNYRSRQDEIRTRFTKDIDRIRGELSDRSREVAQLCARLSALKISSRVLFHIIYGVSARDRFMTYLITAAVGLGLLPFVMFGDYGLTLFMSGLVPVTYVPFVLISVSEHRSRQQRVRDGLQESKGTYEEERARLVRESVRRKVTELFREAGIVTFPMLAPTLVELSTAKIASSRTHDEVIDFIRSHETSAIGIAGSRGAGKSTLMGAVRAAEGLASHHVHLTAPVRYEAVDFVRQLFTDAAKEIRDKSGHAIDSGHVVRRRRLFRQRLVRDALALGMLIVLTGVVFFWGLRDPVWTWDWRTSVGLAATAVLVIVVISGAVSLVTTMARSDSRAALFKFPRSVRLAVDALDDLAWTTEAGQKQTGSVKLLGDLLTVGGEDSLTHKQRELSPPALVARFREMLTQFSRDHPGERFVIFIDELDKLDNIDDLVNAINGIKDLLHLPGVHFVVSVSVDALARFEERGMAARDAFDSAFDTVIRMRPLVLEESQSILASRAANFPPVLVLCCHVWSGGLARDLLRSARRCVEINRRSRDVPDVSEVMVRMVTEDILTHIENALRADHIGDHLGQLRQVVKAVRNGADPLEELRRLGDADGQVDHVTRVGLALLAYIRHAPAGERRWELPPDDWNPTIETLAAAMAARAEPAAIRDEALREAVEPITSG